MQAHEALRTAICKNTSTALLFQRRGIRFPERAGLLILSILPVFVYLRMDGSDKPELRIDGYVEGEFARSRPFSTDNSADELWLHADDIELQGDGSDATRLAFGAVDKFGGAPIRRGDASFETEGPGEIVGDNPFHLAARGGIGAVWVRTISGRTGRIKVEAKHARLGGAQ